MSRAVFTANQIVAHMAGDYLLQSDWMATEKTAHSMPAVAHAVTYTLPFLILTRNPKALAAIAGTHFLIDRFRLARHVSWAKNWLGTGNKPWAECKATGYDPDRPPWMSVWLMIITDNTMHLIINGTVLRLTDDCR